MNRRRRRAVTVVLVAAVGLAGGYGVLGHSLPGDGVPPAGDEAGPDDGRTIDGNGTPGTPRLLHDGASLSLDAAEGQVVRGETELPPGTTLRVRLVSEGGPTFRLSHEATVGEDGEFRADFDLSFARPGTPFSASVHHPNGTLLVEATGSVAG